jgi:hypothetical protein
MTAITIMTVISVVGLVLAGILLPLASVVREREVGPEGRIGGGATARKITVALLLAALLALAATIARILMLAT